MRRVGRARDLARAGSPFDPHGAGYRSAPLSSRKGGRAVVLLLRCYLTSIALRVARNVPARIRTRYSPLGAR
jgi:hypothetical protein